MRNLLVLGSGRSGTSMVAGTLSASGWWVGDDPYPGRAANRKGFFETAEINGINEELLARVLPPKPAFEHGQRWLCTLAAGVEPRADETLRGRIAKLVARTPFAFKDPRLCYTLPVWEPLLPQGTGRVCVFREPGASAASIVRECAEAPYLARLALDEQRALAVWSCMYERVLAQCGKGDWLFVHFDQMLTQDGLGRLERFAGAALDRRFPEASLRHAREREPVAGRAGELYRELCERAGHTPQARIQVPVSAAVPELSVILCTYQRLPILQRSIASFEAQDARPGSFELVVVDDGCSDGTGEWLDAHEFRVPARVLHKPNGGLASARNVALAAARGRILLFVNDDTLAFPDLVREHLRAHAELAATGRAAAVLGTFEQPSAQLSTALMRHLEHSGEVFRYHDMRSGEFYDHNRFWTCNVSVAAERVRAAGGFDERFRRYGCEDIDLGLRLERLGLRVCFQAGARAHHEHLLDFAALRRRQQACSASFVHYFAKHPSELDHPDWAWLAGRSAESIRAELRARSEREAQLEAALETLARVELPPLEALGEVALAQQVLERLGKLLGELNALWWQAGFVQGLSEIGCASFDELRAREPQTTLGGLRGEFSSDHARMQLERARLEAGAGELVLARLRVISLCTALEGSAESEMRHEALAEFTRLERLAGQAAARREIVELAQSRAQLLRARVLWLGAAAPEARLRAAGVRSAQSCAVAEELELEESSLDVVIGPLPATQAGLRALARALRPGGRWLCALGRDAGLPDYAEELLDARELAWYRERSGLGAEAPRAIPREALDLRSAGFEFTPPRAAGAGAASPALLRELARVHAGWLELAAAGDTCLLVRRGRTITIGELAASAAGA